MSIFLIHLGKHIKLTNILNISDFQYCLICVILSASLSPLCRYIVFSRYWTDLICIGIFPLAALILLNYGIYTKIRFASLSSLEYCTKIVESGLMKLTSSL